MNAHPRDELGLSGWILLGVIAAAIALSVYVPYAWGEGETRNLIAATMTGDQVIALLLSTLGVAGGIIVAMGSFIFYGIRSAAAKTQAEMEKLAERVDVKVGGLGEKIADVNTRLARVEGRFNAITLPGEPMNRRAGERE